MNISKIEQRVLHVLARGGRIRHFRDGARVVAVDCDLATFLRLRRRGFVRSRGGGPYELTELGRRSVRSQLDNR